MDSGRKLLPLMIREDGKHGTRAARTKGNTTATWEKHEREKDHQTPHKRRESSTALPARKAYQDRSTTEWAHFTNTSPGNALTARNGNPKGETREDKKTSSGGSHTMTPGAETCHIQDENQGNMVQMKNGDTRNSIGRDGEINTYYGYGIS